MIQVCKCKWKQRANNKFGMSRRTIDDINRKFK